MSEIVDITTMGDPTDVHPSSTKLNETWPSVMDRNNTKLWRKSETLATFQGKSETLAKSDFFFHKLPLNDSLY